MILAAAQEGLKHLEAHAVVVDGEDPHADGELVPPRRGHTAPLLRPHEKTAFSNSFPTRRKITKNRHQLFRSEKQETNFAYKLLVALALVPNQETKNPKSSQLQRLAAPTRR
jgi:hypothetical protein